MGETLTWPERQTLADKAYGEVKSRILQSVLEPGDKLSIDGLAKRLEISQTPIREALARLESEGLVERRPLSGYRVTSLLTADEFVDLFDMRMLLEPEAARRAATVDPSAHRTRETETLRTLARVPEIGSDIQLGHLEFTEADQRFHSYIGVLSGNAMLARSITRLDAHLHLHRSFIPSQAIADTEAEHLAIADAIIAEKPLAAEKAMRAHLENSRVRHAPAFQSADTAAEE